MRRRCKQVAKEVARITSSGQDATTIVYALEQYGQQVFPWAEDVMLQIVEMSDRQNLGMWRELSGKLTERLQTLTTRDAVALPRVAEVELVHVGLLAFEQEDAEKPRDGIDFFGRAGRGDHRHAP